MKCENCGIDHNGSYGSGRFCSSKCARGFSTKANRDEISRKVSIALGGTGELKKGHNSHCLQCSKKLSHSQKKFCSKECEIQYKQDQYFAYIESIGEFVSGDNNKTPKKYLIHKLGHKCQICGVEKWMGKPVPLVLDHIDGNSDNHKLDNCRLVCRNCDGLLSTFAGRNKGNGRHTKRMQDKKRREIEGKSR